MTTTTRFVDASGAPVPPGDYEITDTRVTVTAVTRMDGFTIDYQDAAIEHVVAPRPDTAPAVDTDEHPADPVARCVHCAEFVGKHGAASLSCLRAGFAGNRYSPMSDEDERQYLRAALHEIHTAFQACFTPDFKGVDWDDDAAIQTLAARVFPVLERATKTPTGAPA